MTIEGWYLLSDLEVEQVLLAIKAGDEPDIESQGLDQDAALAFRDRGNVPDEADRVLRLFLRFEGESDHSVERKRIRFEPDFHSAPNWRRPGSRPVNVIPLGLSQPSDAKPWWEDAAMAELEEEWSRSGTVSGVTVPAEYRSFVYKTVVALRASNHVVSASSIADSAARWLPAEQAEALRRALEGDDASA